MPTCPWTSGTRRAPARPCRRCRPAPCRRASSTSSFVGGRAELGAGFRVELDDLEPAGLHRRRPSPRPASARRCGCAFSMACGRGRDLRLVVGRDLVPGVVRRRSSAPTSGATCSVEHVLRVAEDLQREREVRRVRRRVDHARRELQLRGNVRSAAAPPGGSRSTRTTAPSGRRPCSCRASTPFTSASVLSGFFENSCDPAARAPAEQVKALRLRASARGPARASSAPPAPRRRSRRRTACRTR